MAQALRSQLCRGVTIAIQQRRKLDETFSDCDLSRLVFDESCMVDGSSTAGLRLATKSAAAPAAATDRPAPASARAKSAAAAARGPGRRGNAAAVEQPGIQPAAAAAPGTANRAGNESIRQRATATAAPATTTD